jgi:hypothetical protein
LVVGLLLAFLRIFWREDGSTFCNRYFIMSCLLLK